MHRKQEEQNELNEPSDKTLAERNQAIFIVASLPMQGDSFTSLLDTEREQRLYTNGKSLGTKCPPVTSNVKIPEHADVVVIGGGSAGCNALYHMGKCGIKAVLVEKSKIISGTTWHTAGLVWSIRGPNDVEMELLKSTRRVLDSLEEETGINPGWIKNGGLYIAHSPERLAEFKRLVTGSKVFGIEAHTISPREAKQLFPLLDETAFLAAVYSPADGAIDPAMLTNALIKSAKNHDCKIIEDCPVTKILTRKTVGDGKRVYGIETPYGVIKTDVILAAAGTWSRDVAKMVQLDIPLVTMKHAYVVTEPINGLQGRPHVRDPDIGLYFRIQGSSLSIGGYEGNPIMLSTPPENFSFGLYELDWSVFNAHIESMVRLMPELSTTGIRTTICGPESFTPDHKPIMGEDPRCSGLFYSCGYNSAGMMLGGGCGEQIARWILNGRPDRHMFNYDIRRFIPEQRNNTVWANERTHEAYAKNYDIAYPHDEPLGGRNLKTDPFHDLLLDEGAVMEERQGWERPGWFASNKRNIRVLPYDYGGHYGKRKNENDEYRVLIEKERTFQFSPHHDTIQEEALACRKNAVLFDMSYFGKFYLCGPEVQRAADYLFTSKTDRYTDKTIYSCMLNHAGGVEADCTVTVTSPGSGGIIDPIFRGTAMYIVSSGMSAYQAWAHMNKAIEEKGFDVSLHDVTEQIGVLSVQGPNSRNILQGLMDHDISEDAFPFSTTKLVKINGELVRLIRLSFVGELGFELHIPRSSCQTLYKALMSHAKRYDLKLAGYRALYSLSCEKGYHLWGSDLRTDDNPIEAGLGFVCRKDGEYLGKTAVDASRKNGIKKRLVHFRTDSNVPMWGLEAIYRDNCLVGYLRRAEQRYGCQSVIGQGYVEHPNGENVTKRFLETGNYEIEVTGKRYPTRLHLRSPFDPQNRRLMGVY